MKQARTGVRWGLGMLVAVGLLGTPGSARGQALLARPGEAHMAAPSPIARTFGTATSTTHVIHASEFELLTSAGASTFVGVGPQRFATGSLLVAGLRLPAGAVIQSVELEGCDTAAPDLLFTLFRASSPGGGAIAVSAAGASVGTPGCDFFSVAPLPAVSPLVVDNENNTYALVVSASSALTTFAAARIYYALQVSPAPGAATFSDVPTSHRGSRAAAAAAISVRTPR